MLAAGILLIACAVGVGASASDTLNPGAQMALLVLGSMFLGASIYAEGVRRTSDHDKQQED